jgi:hypothetical protein
MNIASAHAPEIKKPDKFIVITDLKSPSRQGRSPLNRKSYVLTMHKMANMEDTPKKTKKRILKSKP